MVMPSGPRRGSSREGSGLRRSGVRCWASSSAPGEGWYLSTVDLDLSGPRHPFGPCQADDVWAVCRSREAGPRFAGPPLPRRSCSSRPGDAGGVVGAGALGSSSDIVPLCALLASGAIRRVSGCHGGVGALLVVLLAMLGLMAMSRRPTSTGSAGTRPPSSQRRTPGPGPGLPSWTGSGGADGQLGRRCPARPSFKVTL